MKAKIAMPHQSCYSRRLINNLWINDVYITTALWKVFKNMTRAFITNLFKPEPRYLQELQATTASS